MSRYDKYDPKTGGYRAPLAADWDPDDRERIYGVGHNGAGAVVIGAGQTGITGVLVLTKARKAGEIIDVMTRGEVIEFGPTVGEPGVDFGEPGTVYYSDADGNIEKGVDEVQTVTVTNTANPWTITIDGHGPSANISGTATTAAVQAAIDAIDGIEPGDVVVGGSGPYTLTFAGQFAGEDVPTVTLTNATVATTTAGGGVNGLVRVGHTVRNSRLIVKVEN